MTEPGNDVIAHTLHWLAVLLEIDGSEPARIASYRHAAQVVRALDAPVSEVLHEGGTSALERHGLTTDASRVIADWVRTGELPVLENTRRADKLWPALTRALCRTLGIPARVRPGPSAPRRPIHRAVWESWN